MSRLFRLSLILCLMLTSIALASARGQATIGERVVLCSGQAVILTYGPDGAPSESPHYCPDMALAMLSAVAPSMADPVLFGSALAIDFQVAPTGAAGRDRVSAQARGPPPFSFS